jgi:hypothetical protein
MVKEKWVKNFNGEHIQSGILDLNSYSYKSTSQVEYSYLGLASIK